MGYGTMGYPMLVLEPIELKVHTKVSKSFKTLAKKTFPKEAFAYLLGHEAGNSIEITELWIPDEKELNKYSTNWEVTPQESWAVQALEYAQEHDLVALGSIHSHPWSYSELRIGFPGHAPSEDDLLNGFCSTINGICNVCQNKEGKLRASILFWGPMVPLVVEHIK